MSRLRSWRPRRNHGAVVASPPYWPRSPSTSTSASEDGRRSSARVVFSTVQNPVADPESTTNERTRSPARPRIRPNRSVNQSRSPQNTDNSARRSRHTSTSGCHPRLGSRGSRCKGRPRSIARSTFRRSGWLPATRRPNTSLRNGHSRAHGANGRPRCGRPDHVRSSRSRRLARSNASGRATLRRASSSDRVSTCSTAQNSSGCVGGGGGGGGKGTDDVSGAGAREASGSRVSMGAGRRSMTNPNINATSRALSSRAASARPPW